MALGAYGSELGRGSVLNALAHPSVVNPVGAILQGTEAASTITQLRQRQFDLQQAQLQPAYQAMRQLMATNQNPSWDDVNNALAQSARIGGNIDGLVANATETMGRGGKPADFMRATALGGMSPERQGELVGPQRQTFDTGAGTVYGTTPGAWSANAGQFTPAGFMERGLTPSEATGFIAVPQPDGTVKMVPRGTLFGGGAGGPGGPATGGGGGGGGQPLLPPNAPAQAQDALLPQIMQRESGGRNVPNQQGPGGTPLSDASGYYQMRDDTWQRFAKLAGIQNPPPRAIDASFADQTAAARAGLNAEGEQPWAASALGGAGGGGDGRGGPTTGPFIGATSAQPVAGAAPVQPGGGGSAVRPAGGGGMQYFDPTGRPMGAGGGGGFQMPGVARGPGGAPILTPPSPYELPQFEQSSKDYVADQVNNRTLSRRIAPLQNAISLIKENPSLVTGPSADNWYQWVQGLAAATGIDVGDVHNANAYNELTKQLAMNLQQSGADPTDMARLMHEASQPNTMQGRQAIVTLAAEQIGYQRMKSAQYLEFRSRHPADANTRAQFYNQETGDWASQQDPMAYAADLIPQAELQAHLRGLNPDQQRAFVDSLNNAKRLFKFNLPTGGKNGG